MNEKKSYKAPEVVILQANFSGLLCISGGNSTSNPNPQLSMSQASRYGNASTMSWN